MFHCLSQRSFFCPTCSTGVFYLGFHGSVRSSPLQLYIFNYVTLTPSPRFGFALKSPSTIVNVGPCHYEGGTVRNSGLCGQYSGLYPAFIYRGRGFGGDTFSATSGNSFLIFTWKFALSDNPLVTIATLESPRHTRRAGEAG